MKTPHFMSALHRMLATGLILTALTAAATAGTISQYQLPNGLTVILAPMTGTQRVSIVTRYDVGSADEPKGRSGFAHLFEHLMFEGTHAVPDFDAAASALGAEQNAFTEWDATTYYIVGPKEYLPNYLRLEADRMANLADAVSQEDLDNQRAVIGNELRERTLDSPGGAAREQSLAALAGPGHPYGHSPIGSVADLAAAKLEDVRGFHRTYYVPANAVVTVTGSFDEAGARKLIGQTFGLVPQEPMPFHARPAEPEPTASRLSFTDAVETPTVSLIWNGPPSSSREDTINTILNYALSSDAGPLYQRLVERDRLAANAAVSWESRKLGGVFAVKAKAAKGVSAERLEQGLKTAFAEILKEGVTAERLSAASQSISSAYDQAVADPNSFGFILEQAEADTGSALSWHKLADIARSLGTDEATAALRKFAGEPDLVVTLNPGERNKMLPPVLSEPTGSTEPIAVTARADVEIPDLPALARADTSIPKAETFTLSNGIPVSFYKNNDPANAALVLSLPEGTTMTSGDQTGLADIVLDLSARGAGDLSRSKFSAESEAAGVQFSQSVSAHASALLLSAPAKNFSKGIDLLATAILAPRFDQSDWDTQIAQAAISLEQANSQPDYVASNEATTAIYAPDAPEGRKLTAAAVRGLQMADGEALFRRMLRPDLVHIQVISSLPADEVLTELEKHFGRWAIPATLSPLPHAATPAFASRELRFDVTGATQAAVAMEFAAPSGFTREAAAFELSMQVLAGSSNSRLNKILREEKGWSYGISGGVTAGEKGLSNSMGMIFTTVEAGRTGDALTEMRRIIAELAQTPISEAEFLSAKQEVRAGFLGAFDTTSSFASIAAATAMLGYDFSAIETKLKLMDEVTLDNVRAAAANLSKLDKVTVVAGDPQKMR